MNILIGKFAHRRAGTTAGQDLFWQKKAKITERLRKNYEYTAWKVFWKKSERFAFFCVCTGWRRWEVGFFPEKFGFLLSVCRKILNIRLGRCSSRETRGPGLFSFFFRKNSDFYWAFAKKTWIKGVTGSHGTGRGWLPRPPPWDGGFQKNFNFFWKQGPKYDLPGNNPDRGTSRRRNRDDTTFFQKKPEKPWSFSKKFRIYCMEGFFQKKGWMIPVFLHM